MGPGTRLDGATSLQCIGHGPLGRWRGASPWGRGKVTTLQSDGTSVPRAATALITAPGACILSTSFVPLHAPPLFIPYQCFEGSSLLILCYKYGGAFLVAQLVKNPPEMLETWV